MSKTRKNTKRSSKSNKRVTSDADEILDHMIGDDENLREMVKQAEHELEIAQLIYDARNAAGITQEQLAELIGSKQTVISRLESANYQGHSLSMLQRIANALGKRLEIRFVEAEVRQSA